jgi:hypothetical protein
MIISKKSGQAMIEYLLIFGMMSLIAIKMTEGFGSMIDETVGGLGVALTNALTTGVCERNCFFTGYLNQ